MRLAGGPQHYTERFGHPMLRARHMPFPIANKERDQWLARMDQAMQETGAPADLRTRLKASFSRPPTDAQQPRLRIKWLQPAPPLREAL